jgi:hypothetical protein
MTTLEIKDSFHHLIDSIDNDQLLLKFYELMKNRTSTKDGNLWTRLTQQEQEELLAAFEESKDHENLISQDDMMKKHKKWL